MTHERIPPQDLEAERALLGCMMIDVNAIARVLELAPSEDIHRWLYTPAHRAIFDALLELYEANNPIEIITVRNNLEQHRELESCGGVDYLVKCAESIGSVTSLDSYFNLVREKGMLRDLIECTDKIQTEAYAARIDAGDIFERSEKSMFAVTERRVRGEVAPLGRDVEEILAQLDAKSRGEIDGLRCGYRLIDDKTTGFQPGDLNIIAARPSIGKTAIALNIATHIAATQGPVLFFSLEMTRQQVATRILCSVAGVDSQLVRKRLHGPEQRERLHEAKERMRDWHTFLVDDTSSLTPLEARAIARRAVANHGVVAIFIDYLQLMRQPGAENKRIEIGDITASLKALGRELAIPMIVLAQLNRASEEGDKRPMLRHLKESGKIEEDADVVLMLHRPGFYERDKDDLKTKAELIIAKQRNGPTDIVELVYDATTTTFKNKADEHSYPVESGTPSYQEQAEMAF